MESMGKIILPNGIDESHILHPELSLPLWNVSHLFNVDIVENEVAYRGRAVDAYLLVSVLAQRIAAGDIEINDIGDSCGKKEYYDKLVCSCRKLFEIDK